jgi:hypothetical protein
MEDFVTWVLLRLDELMAAEKDRVDVSRPIPKRTPDRILPFGAAGSQEEDSLSPRPAA